MSGLIGYYMMGVFVTGNTLYMDVCQGLLLGGEEASRVI